MVKTHQPGCFLGTSAMNMMISWDLTNEHGELVGFDHQIGGVLAIKIWGCNK
jgi:hypothetical protein